MLRMGKKKPVLFFKGFIVVIVFLIFVNPVVPKNNGPIFLVADVVKAKTLISNNSQTTLSPLDARFIWGITFIIILLSLLIMLLFILLYKKNRAEKQVKKLHDSLNQELIAANEKIQRQLIELKQDQYALNSSEKTFRTIFERAAIGIILIDMKGFVIDSNSAFQNMIGYNLLELCGMDYKRFTHPDDVAVFNLFFKELIQQERRFFSLEARYLQKDKANIWIRSTVSFVPNEKKETQFAIVMIENISEHKETESGLRESEEKYRALFEASADGILLETLDGRILDCNSSSCDIYGYSKEELLDRRVSDLVPERVKQRLGETINEKLKKGSMFLETFNKRKNGVMFPVEIRTQFTIIGNEQLITVYIRDITERKKAEQELKNYRHNLEKLVEERTESLSIMNDKLKQEIMDRSEIEKQRKQIEEELRASQKYTQNLIDSSLDMIISVDEKRRIVEFNKAAQQIFGYKKEEILGEKITILYNDPISEAKIIGRHLRQAKQFVGEILNKKKDGSVFPAFISASSLYDKEGKPIGSMGISRDISELKRSEKLLARLTSEIHSSIKNKLESAKLFLTDGKSFLAHSIEEAMYCFNMAEKLVSYVTNVSKNILFVTTNKTCSIKRLYRELELRAEMILANAGIQYDIIANHLSDQIMMNLESVEYILEIYTEILNNATKHSYANHVKIDMTMNTINKDEIILSVADDGIGFNYSEQKAKEDSYGLDIMEQLALQADAYLLVESIPRKGTFVKTIVKK